MGALEKRIRAQGASADASAGNQAEELVREQLRAKAAHGQLPEWWEIEQLSRLLLHEKGPTPSSTPSSTPPNLSDYKVNSVLLETPEPASAKASIPPPML